MTKEKAIETLLWSHKCYPFANAEAFETRLKQLGFKIVPDVVPQWAKDPSGRWG